MKVIVIGCGRMGAELAYQLYKSGQDVSVIDDSDDAFKLLPADFNGRFFEGDAMSYDILRRAGIEKCDSLAVVTNNDPLNLVIARVAREEFKVKNVVARNYDPQLRPLYDAFDIQYITATGWAAQRLEEMIYHSEVRTVFSAGNGEIEIYEFTIGDGCAGNTFKSLLAGAEAIPVSLTRSGKSVLPNMDSILELGDIIHVSSTLEGVKMLRSRICPSGKIGGKK